MSASLHMGTLALARRDLGWLPARDGSHLSAQQTVVIRITVRYQLAGSLLWADNASPSKVTKPLFLQFVLILVWDKHLQVFGPKCRTHTHTFLYSFQKHTLQKLIVKRAFIFNFLEEIFKCAF